MNVFLTGATGFVGGYVLRALIHQGHRARCLVRNAPRTLDVKSAGVEQVEGNVTDAESLKGKLEGCDAVIHLVGIIEEKPSKSVTFERIHFDGTRHVVDAAVKAGITRFVQMSANGARPEGVSRYQTTKWKAEEYVRNADFEHAVVFRPTLIFGDPGADRPEFATRIANSLVKPFPVLPVFGDGQYEMQPVAVHDVASAFVHALTLEAAAGKTYCTAGPERITFVELLDRLTDAVGHARKKKIYQPIGLARPLIQTVGRTGLLPISPDQFEMLVEGNTCDASEFQTDFDVSDTRFTPENLTYLQRR